MNGYLELFDSPKYGRAYVLRLIGKVCAVSALTASFYFFAAENVGTGARLFAAGLLTCGIPLGYWSFFPKYICPKCERRMEVTRKKRIGAGGAAICLACNQCKAFIDLKVADE